MRDGHWAGLASEQMDALIAAHEAARDASRSRQHAAQLMRRARHRGCTPDQIATVTGLSVGAVSSLIRDCPPFLGIHPEHLAAGDFP